MALASGSIVAVGFRFSDDLMREVYWVTIRLVYNVEWRENPGDLCDL
jgi:hypothetical protein